MRAFLLASLAVFYAALSDATLRSRPSMSSTASSSGRSSFTSSSSSTNSFTSSTNSFASSTTSSVASFTSSLASYTEPSQRLRAVFLGRTLPSDENEKATAFIKGLKPDIIVSSAKFDDAERWQNIPYLTAQGDSQLVKYGNEIEAGVKWIQEARALREQENENDVICEGVPGVLEVCYYHGVVVFNLVASSDTSYIKSFLRSAFIKYRRANWRVCNIHVENVDNADYRRFAEEIKEACRDHQAFVIDGQNLEFSQELTEMWEDHLDSIPEEEISSRSPYIAIVCDFNPKNNDAHMAICRYYTDYKSSELVAVVGDRLKFVKVKLPEEDMVNEWEERWIEASRPKMKKEEPVAVDVKEKICVKGWMLGCFLLPCCKF